MKKKNHISCLLFHRSSSRAFTLIEIVVVTAITAIIAGVSMASFAQFSKKEALDAAATAIAAGLRDARAQTLASVGGSQYGIQISPTSFVFFQGAVYNVAASTNRPFDFGTFVLASSSRSVYVFQRLTGNAVASGTIDVYLASDPLVKRTIEIAATGLVDIQ